MSIGFGVGRYLIKRSIVTSHNIRFENISFTEDRIFQLDLLLEVERVAHADFIVYYYVQHPSSITHEPKKREYSKYAGWLWHYIERLSDTINDTNSLNNNAKTVVDGWRDMAVFSLLINCFKYCPVSINKTYLNQVQGIKGAYPLRIESPFRTVRFVRRLMGHKRLWIILCRVFHILPHKVRVSL